MPRARCAEGDSWAEGTGGMCFSDAVVAAVIGAGMTGEEVVLDVLRRSRGRDELRASLDCEYGCDSGNGDGVEDVFIASNRARGDSRGKTATGLFMVVSPIGDTGVAYVSSSDRSKARCGTNMP